MPTLEICPQTALHGSPSDLQNLTTEQLTNLSTNPEMLEAVRTEVYRRLCDSPRKANFLTFRWRLPANEVDQTDAFNGLVRTCWNALEARHAVDRVRFLDIRGNVRDFPKFDDTKDTIIDELTECLWNLRLLSVQEVIAKALNDEFQTDAKVGNAVRRKVQQGRKMIALDSKVASSDQEGQALTLFEVLEDKGSRSNPYSEAVEVIFQEKPQVVEELGEEGWEVLEQVVELEDNGLFPKTKREQQRVLTGLFETAYGVNPRQARTYKSRFLASIEAAASAGKPVFEWIAELLTLLGCWDAEESSRNDCRESPLSGNE